MSRLNAYINKDVMEREDVATMMADDSTDIKLLRYTDLSDNDGFREQSPKRKLRFLCTIKGRIDRRDRIYQRADSEAGSVVDALYIATVYYKDLRKDDVLQVGAQQYRVEAVNKVGQSFTEAEVVVST